MTMETGYFARPTYKGVIAARSRYVHFFDHEKQKCLCGYKPHKTMNFQFCSDDAYDSYCNCPRCKKELIRLKNLTKLKNCPFCAGKTKIKNGGDWHIIGCFNKKCNICPKTKWSKDKQLIITYWNNRN